MTTYKDGFIINPSSSGSTIVFYNKDGFEFTAHDFSGASTTSTSTSTTTNTQSSTTTSSSTTATHSTTTSSSSSTTTVTAMPVEISSLTNKEGFTLSPYSDLSTIVSYNKEGFESILHSHEAIGPTTTTTTVTYTSTSTTTTTATQPPSPLESFEGFTVEPLTRGTTIVFYNKEGLTYALHDGSTTSTSTTTSTSSTASFTTTTFSGTTTTHSTTSSTTSSTYSTSSTTSTTFSFTTTTFSGTTTTTTIDVAGVYQAFVIN